MMTCFLEGKYFLFAPYRKCWLQVGIWKYDLNKE